MEKIILTGFFIFLAVLFAGGGVWFYRRIGRLGNSAGCACLLCFLALVACGIVVFKQFPEETAAAFLAAFCGFSFWNKYRFFKRAIIVPGVVRDFESRRFREYFGFPIFIYWPVVQFEFDGQTRQVTGSGYSYFKPILGKPMQVGIDPQNIANVRVYKRTALIFDGVIAILGTIFLIRMVYSRLAGI